MARVEAYWRRESLTYLTDGKVGSFGVLLLRICSGACLEHAFLAAT